MKKLLLSVSAVLLLFSAQAFALAMDEQSLIDQLYGYLKGTATPPHGEIDIRIGFDPLSGVSYMGGDEVGGFDYSSVPDTGVSLGAEYIFPVSTMFRFGGGAQYITQRETDGYRSADGKISYVPVYAVVQANPLWFLPGIFFKFNAGYSFFFFENDRNPYTRISAGNNGFTWGFAAGVTVTKDWSVEVSYNKYYSSINIDWTTGESGTKNMTFSKLGIALMYRIRL
ncbi:MAG: outer membrane beta-barrel protein [Endomicrobium sp.]|nr:outer membrane beta-barrel protein [Endomicrobium sp.]